MCHEREGHMECTDTSIGRLVSFHKNFEVAFFQTRMSCHVQILPFAGLCPKRSITCTTRLQKPSPGSSCRFIIHFARGHSRLPAITDWCISNTCQCFQLSENSVAVEKHWNTRGDAQPRRYRNYLLQEGKSLEHAPYPAHLRLEWKLPSNKHLLRVRDLREGQIFEISFSSTFWDNI